MFKDWEDQNLKLWNGIEALISSGMGLKLPSMHTPGVGVFHEQRETRKKFSSNFIDVNGCLSWTT